MKNSETGERGGIPAHITTIAKKNAGATGPAIDFEIDEADIGLAVRCQIQQDHTTHYTYWYPTYIQYYYTEPSTVPSRKVPYIHYTQH